MKSKKIIIDKTTYGGTLVDKYFLIFDDGSDEQVPPSVWDWYEVGDEYPREIPKTFDSAIDDIKEGRTVPLDKALTEEPPIDWKEAHDMQQKLVVHYVLENEKLKDKIKELEAPSESVEKICKQIEELYRQNEYYRMHNHILETANDDLATMNETMKDTLINIWECFEIRDDLYTEDWHALQAFANKARICLECIGYDVEDNKKR
jgi:hypothetical protein